MKKLLLTAGILLLTSTAYAGSFTINYPNAIGPGIVNSYVRVYDYRAEIQNPDESVGGTIPNPETKIAFTKRMIREQIVKTYRRGIALLEKDIGDVKIRDKKIQANIDASNLTVE